MAHASKETQLVYVSTALAAVATVSLAAFNFQQDNDLTGSHAVYAVDVKDCWAKGYTLSNSKEVSQFLAGRGIENEQVLDFIADQNVTEVSAGLSIWRKLFPVNVTAVIDGERKKNIILRREQVPSHLNFEGYGFKISGAAADRPSGSLLNLWGLLGGRDLCETVRTHWKVFDGEDGSSFISEEEWANSV